MAKLRIITTQEALSYAYCGEWNVKTRQSLANDAQVTIQLSHSAGKLLIYADVDIYLSFSNSSGTTNSVNDIILPASQLHEIAVPIALHKNGTLYVHMKAVTTTTDTKYVRVVEM